MSDIHLEFEVRSQLAGDRGWHALRDARRTSPGHPEIGPYLGNLKGNIDLLVVAGDVQPGAQGVRWLAEVADWLADVPVVTVAGNHEFYGHSLPELRRALADECAAAGVEFLDCRRIDYKIRGRTLAVLGTTLWTDFTLSEPLLSQAMAMQQARNTLTDYSGIRLDGSALRPEDTLEMHLAARAWLEEEGGRARAEADAVLVVSHHAPIRAAAPLDGKRAEVAFAYASPMDDVVAELGADAWIYGHTHEVRTIRCGRTLVATAGRGYVGRGVDWGFRPAILEI